MKSNLTIVGLAAVLLSLCVPMAGFAVCPASGFNPFLVADGTPVLETIQENGGRIYTAQLTAGHSYSLQVISPGFNSSGLAYTLDPTGTLQGGVATTTDTTSTDPRIEDFSTARGGRRLSILVSSSGHFVYTFCNTDGNAHSLVVTLVETTLFSPRWSTFGGFHTEFGFRNTTNAAIDGTLTLFNDDGTANVVSNITIPVNGTAFRDTRAVALIGPDGLNVADDNKGSAVFTHNGPPGAILADIFIVHPGFPTGPFVVPGKFETARQMR